MTARAWSAAEDAIAADPRLSVEEVAERLGRGMGSVRHRRKKLKVTTGPERLAQAKRLGGLKSPGRRGRGLHNPWGGL